MLYNLCCKCIAVCHIFAAFSISKNRHNTLDGFITHVDNKVNTTSVYGQIRKTLHLLSYKISFIIV